MDTLKKFGIPMASVAAIITLAACKGPSDDKATETSSSASSNAASSTQNPPPANSATNVTVYPEAGYINYVVEGVNQTLKCDPETMVGIDLVPGATKTFHGTAVTAKADKDGVSIDADGQLSLISFVVNKYDGANVPEAVNGPGYPGIRLNTVDWGKITSITLCSSGGM